MEITISDRDDYMQIRVRKMREGRVLVMEFQTGNGVEVPDYHIFNKDTAQVYSIKKGDIFLRNEELGI